MKKNLTVTISTNICAFAPNAKVTVLPPATAEDMLGVETQQDRELLNFERLYVPTPRYAFDREHILAGVGRNAIARMGDPEFDF